MPTEAIPVGVKLGCADCTALGQLLPNHLLKVEPAMWLFVTTEGVEPTNNAAESLQTLEFAATIPPAVLWRRISFGTQSEAGSTFVACMLTVVTTLRFQQRNFLEYMTAACRAAREGQPAPSLLPKVTNSEDQVLSAA